MTKSTDIGMNRSLDKILRRSAPGAGLGEGPLWSRRDGCVYWVDIIGRMLHSYRLDDSGQRRWSFPEPIAWVIERRQGDFICGLQSGFAALTLAPFSLRPLVNPYPQQPENRLNDAKADHRGRIWAGSMHQSASKRSGALYRLNVDFTLNELDSPYHIANGPTFSRDHSRVYHTETDSGEIFRFDLDASGEPVNKRLFVRFDGDMGKPDGMTTDCADGIWVAHWGGGRVSRFTPDARLDFSISLPASQITSLCFAGDRLDRLFVTSAADGVPGEAEAGTLFELSGDLLRGHRGLEPCQFGG